MAVDYTVVKHTVCHPGNLLASDYGEHMVSLKIANNTDNGRIVKVGKFVSLDQFEADTATAITAEIAMKGVDGLYLVVVRATDDDQTALIYEKPLVAEESPKQLTVESAFYNDPQDGPVRGYILHALDRFWLSADGFSGTPEVGASITAIDTDGKLVC